ncbi:Peptidoglycan-binding domain 1 protein [Magnetospirillum sp. SS-4]|nr:Peptidoglycan-binding domain 1 protein [Magnetospirillum sp. SS-4]
MVNIFETGSARGDYGRVVHAKHDSGQLTYGRSQVTLASGGLHALIRQYCETPGARHTSGFISYLSDLANKTPALDSDAVLHGLLKAAGDDPVMRDCQDSLFDNGYWLPALKSAAALSLPDPLSVCVVYDSHIHGSWKTIRDRTLARAPDSAAAPRDWTTAYVATRRDWLAGSPNPLLRRSVYRMDCFNQLITENAWALPLPLKVRGILLTGALLGEGQAGGARALRRTSPMMRGDDVERLQRALGVAADGVFGDRTLTAVKEFQQRNGLTADGIAGPTTMEIMGL